MQRLKKAPHAGFDDKRKKPKMKESSWVKKNGFKENREPPFSRDKTRIIDSINTCQMLNRTSDEIYDHLYKFRLTEQKMKENDFPSNEIRSKNLVPENCNDRQCIRCGEDFQIYEGLHLSLTKCHYHPKRASFDPRLKRKIYPCCNKRNSEEGCVQFKYHVTKQHGPKTLTKTVPRCHNEKNLKREIFSLDCEMSYTTSGLEVTRVGLVDIDGLTILDSYVRPMNLILDYNTQYSGVEKKHLNSSTATLDDVNKLLRDIIYEDTILVGHALNNDLAALGLIHKTVVDTSVLFADERMPWNKKSLKSLASDLLDLPIQNGSSGHNCIEDARASLRLALLKVPPNPPSRSKSFVPTTKFVPQKSYIENNDFSYELEQQQALTDVQNFVYPPLATPGNFLQHPELKKSLFFNISLCDYYHPNPALM